MNKPFYYNFWVLQIGGWLGWGTMMTFGSVMYHGSFLGAFLYKFTIVALAFSLTVGLRYLYRSSLFQNRTFPTMVVMGILSSFFVSNLCAMGLNYIHSPPDNVELTLPYLLKGSIGQTSLFVAWTALYFGIRHYLDLQASKETALKAEALAHKARLDMLRYQLNPHFLFNSLNSINALISRNPSKAEVMIEELAEFLRYTLAREQRELVRLGQEFDAIRHYLAIEKIRFEEKLEIEEHSTLEAQAWKVPSFLVHPLVENAIKYGMHTSPMPLKLRLSAKVANGVLQIKVTNSGSWAPATDCLGNPASTGIGLQNIRERLKAYYPARFNFDIGPSGDQVIARLELWEHS